MRRRNLLIITLLLLTLLTGGWGGVIAAASCAHDAEQSQASSMGEDHECCRVSLGQSSEHCAAAADSSAPTSHEAMPMGEMQPVATAAERAAHSAIAPVQPTGACLHCAGHSKPPTTFILAREPEQKKRAAYLAPPPTLSVIASLAVTFAQTPSARQHAPPETGARRHLLISVFVI